MKLYDFTLAPNPRRARILIAEKGLDIETIQVDLATREQLGDAYRKINPRCTVPALVLDDGTAICENVAIAHYLEDIHPEPPMFGTTPAQRAAVLEWNSWIEQDGIAAVAESFRNAVAGMAGRAMPGTLDLEQIPALVDRGKKRARHFMSILNERLAGRNFIAIEQYSLADITGLIFIDFAARAKLAVPDELTHLKLWHDNVSARPSAKA